MPSGPLPAKHAAVGCFYADADTIHEPGDLHRAMHEAELQQSRGAELFAAPDCHAGLRNAR